MQGREQSDSSKTPTPTSKARGSGKTRRQPAKTGDKKRGTIDSLGSKQRKGKGGQGSANEKVVEVDNESEAALSDASEATGMLYNPIVYCDNIGTHLQR